jgi:hypothetical protein
LLDYRECLEILGKSNTLVINLNFNRENSELLVAIKKMSPDGKIPKGLLMNGKPAIRNALKEFELSKMLDKENEKMPKPGSRPSDITLRRLI